MATIKNQYRYARIYEVDKNKGGAYPTDFVRDRLTGDVLQSPAKTKSRMPVRKVLESGCECTASVDTLINAKTDIPMDYGNQYGVNRIPSQLTNGGVSNALPQKSSAYGSKVGQWTVKMTNTGTTTARTVIGDTAGIIGDKYGVGVLPATVLVDGTFNAATLGMIKAIVGDVPAHLVGIHIEADDESFFGAGKVSNVVADLTNNSPKEGQIYFNKLAKGNTFNPKIREDEYYTFQMNAYSGVYVEIPAGREISISWDVMSFGQTYLMNQATQ